MLLLVNDHSVNLGVGKSETWKMARVRVKMCIHGDKTALSNLSGKYVTTATTLFKNRTSDRECKLQLNFKKKRFKDNGFSFEINSDSALLFFQMFKDLSKGFFLGYPSGHGGIAFLHRSWKDVLPTRSCHEYYI